MAAEPWAAAKARAATETVVDAAPALLRTEAPPAMFVVM
jgi:hypothetical protein